MDREGIAKAGSEQLMASSQCCAHSIFGSAACSPNSLPVFVCTRPMCCSKEGHPRASTLFEVGSEGGGSGPYNFFSTIACVQHRVRGHVNIHGLGKTQLCIHWYTYSNVLFGDQFVGFICIQFPTARGLAILWLRMWFRVVCSLRSLNPPQFGDPGKTCSNFRGPHFMGVSIMPSGGTNVDLLHVVDVWLHVPRVFMNPFMLQRIEWLWFAQGPWTCSHALFCMQHYMQLQSEHPPPYVPLQTCQFCRFKIYPPNA